MSKRLSLDDFKKWVNEQEDHTPKMKHQKAIGAEVESKVKLNKLMDVITPEEGDYEELAEDFETNGGIVIDSEGKDFLIEVSSGTFYILRNYVRRS